MGWSLNTIIVQGSPTPFHLPTPLYYYTEITKFQIVTRLQSSNFLDKVCLYLLLKALEQLTFIISTCIKYII